MKRIEFLEMYPEYHMTKAEIERWEDDFYDEINLGHFSIPKAAQRTAKDLWQDQKYFNETEAVEYLRLPNVSSLRYLVRNKELAHTPFGKGHWVFRKEDLDKTVKMKLKRDSLEQL